MSIYETLSKVQVELKAPKNLYNTFGNYKYRNAESILEAAKPLCAEHGCTLTLSDEIQLVGTRYYVKSTATVRDKDGNAASVSAFAREDESKRGMDGAQITGTASSYARKYALNGLFCIDDTKDPDTDDYKEEAADKQKKEPKEQEKQTRPPVKTKEQVAAESVARKEYLTALKTFCDLTRRDRNDIGKYISDKVIKKPCAEYTIVDWNDALNYINNLIAKVQNK